jgi:peptidoglycan/xylan/chitin deacetylase (PgdA/CDA1 family)
MPCRNAIPVLLAAAVCALLGGPSASAAPGKVALTFDDLPGLTLRDDQTYVDRLNDDLLRGLRRHRLPAIGFVIGGKIEQMDRVRQIANLDKWLDQGLALGNHTYSHESPNDIGVKAYVEDIARGDPVVRALLARRGRRLEWFRHPYLETGSPAPVKHEIDAWLGSHGYKVAPVTTDANDWEFAEPYDDAVARGDKAAQRRIRAEYLQYTERTIAWSQGASRGLFGRDIPLVMLLHATRLNADSIDALAEILKRRKLVAVSLDEATSDPAYRSPDNYAGPDGIDWLERWSDSLHKPLPWASWQDPPADIVKAYDALNNDRR